MVVVAVLVVEVVQTVELCACLSRSHRMVKLIAGQSPLVSEAAGPVPALVRDPVEYSYCEMFFVSPSVHTAQRLFSGTRLRLSAGPLLPTTTAVLAHGRTPNQHHDDDSSSCPNTRHECGDRDNPVHHSSCRVSRSSRTAPIQNRSLGFSFVPQRTTLNCPSRNAC